MRRLAVGAFALVLTAFLLATGTLSFPSRAETHSRPTTVEEQPSISRRAAVGIAWDHMPTYIHPNSVVADFGTVQGLPRWFVTFEGICMAVSAGPPGASAPPCPITKSTVEVDANNGDWLDTYW